MSVDDVVCAHSMLVHVTSIIASRVPSLLSMSSKRKDDDNACHDGKICCPDDDDNRCVPAIDDVVNECITTSGWEGL